MQRRKPEKRNQCITTLWRPKQSPVPWFMQRNASPTKSYYSVSNPKLNPVEFNPYLTHQTSVLPIITFPVHAIYHHLLTKSKHSLSQMIKENFQTKTPAFYLNSTHITLIISSPLFPSSAFFSPSIYPFFYISGSSFFYPSC